MAKPDFYLVTGGHTVPMVYHRGCNSAYGSTPVGSNFCIACGTDLTGTVPPGRPGNPATGATTDRASADAQLLKRLLR